MCVYMILSMSRAFTSSFRRRQPVTKYTHVFHIRIYLCMYIYDCMYVYEYVTKRPTTNSMDVVKLTCFLTRSTETIYIHIYIYIYIYIYNPVFVEVLVSNIGLTLTLNPKSLGR